MIPDSASGNTSRADRSTMTSDEHIREADQSNRVSDGETPAPPATALAHDSGDAISGVTPLSTSQRLTALLWGFIRPDWRPLLGLAALMVFLGVWDTFRYAALLPLLQSLFGDPAPSASDPGGIFGIVIRLFDRIPADLRVSIGVIAIAGLSVGRALIVAIANSLTNLFNVRVVSRYRASLFRNHIRAKLSILDRSQSGQHLQLMVNETQSISESLAFVVILVKDAASIIGILALMVALSWTMTGIVLLAGGVGTLVTIFVSRKIQTLSSIALTARLQMTNRAQETLTGVRRIRALNLESRATEEFVRESNQSERLLGRSKVLTEWLLPSTEMVGVIALAIVTVIAVEQDVFAQGLEGAPQLLVFLLLVRQLVPRASSINRRYGALMNHTPSLRRVRAALDVDPDAFESGGAQRPAPLVTGRISFENVSLSYPGRPDVLRDVKLEISRGQTIAVVGESGSGKTSLVSLLPRYYDVSSGAICFDDTDISEIDLKHLRDHIGVVSQDVFLFNTTIRDNISMGREDADSDEVESAARAAGAHGFISQLPNGYDTVVGERGVTLSGGQRQRVSIAQVFLRDPEILVLDEATNALDTESEAFVQQSIDELMKGRTVFVVAHRLNTVRGADVIIVLREGEIVEIGDWAELSQAGGAFQSLLALQALSAGHPSE